MSQRFVFYGRLSTTDKQDPALSFPSQRKACEKKATELGGEITCEFTDQESGAKSDRQGWSALSHEAKDRTTRRFDAVVIYATSRLARDRLVAALYEREMRRAGVSIHYATGAGDPDTPEGQVFIGMQQLWDEFERNKLARETKRGMQEGTEQGFRMGGRAPYGYQRDLADLPSEHRGDRDKQRATLVPHPDQAAVVAEIFHLHTKGWGQRAIAEHLNRSQGPPSPSHVSPARNQRNHWAASTIRAILRNPIYTGRMVWNRLDFATARQAGGTPRLRAKEEWVVCEQAHVPLVSDEIFELAQARFEQRPRRQASNGHSRYVLAGYVHCGTGHQPLSMQGKTCKQHHYYACTYYRTYGDVAAREAHSGPQSIFLREDALLPLVERFFAQRIFGPMRLEKLAKQLRTHQREARRGEKLVATRLRQQLVDADRKIKLQIQALEDGIEPQLVSARIAELRADKAAYASALAEIDPGALDAEDDYLAARLARIPDLSQALRGATPQVKRQTFDAFDLKIRFDKLNRQIELSATVSEAVASALENTKALQAEGSQVSTSDIAGAGFEPATFGL